MGIVNKNLEEGTQKFMLKINKITKINHFSTGKMV